MSDEKIDRAALLPVDASASVTTGALPNGEPKHAPGARRAVLLSEAIARLGDKDTIHAFSSPDPYTLLGADWDRADVVAAMQKHGAEEAGQGARSLGHTLAVRLSHGWFFFEAAETSGSGTQGAQEHAGPTRRSEAP